MDDNTKLIDILLIEDNPGDIRLIKEALTGSTVNFTQSRSERESSASRSHTA